MNVLSEPAGVVIADGLAVTERLEEGVAGEDFTFDGMVLLLAQTSYHPHAVLRRLRLARPRFTGDHYRLLTLAA